MSRRMTPWRRPLNRAQSGLTTCAGTDTRCAVCASGLWGFGRQPFLRTQIQSHCFWVDETSVRPRDLEKINTCLTVKISTSSSPSLAPPSRGEDLGDRRFFLVHYMLKCGEPLFERSGFVEFRNLLFRVVLFCHFRKRSLRFFDEARDE